MQANVGDRLVVEGMKVDSPKHEGEVLEVRGADGAPPYVVLEELSGHHRAHRVQTEVLVAAAAVAVAVEAGHRVAAAGFELAAQNVALRHGLSLPC